MKNCILTAAIFLNIGLLNAQNINPMWHHVGPFSTNHPNVVVTDPNYNPFNTGRIDDIAVDPSVVISK